MTLIIHTVIINEKGVVKLNINFMTDDSALLNGFDKLSDILNYNISKSGFKVTIKKGENLKINCTRNEITITYKTKVQVFRALSIALNKIGTDFSIEENEQIDNLSVMIDASRNAVLKPQYIKEMLMRFALMGIDTVMLYTEDTFEIKEYEYF